MPITKRNTIRQDETKEDQEPLVPRRWHGGLQRQTHSPFVLSSSVIMSTSLVASPMPRTTCLSLAKVAVQLAAGPAAGRSPSSPSGAAPRRACCSEGALGASTLLLGGSEGPGVDRPAAAHTAELVDVREVELGLGGVFGGGGACAGEEARHGREPAVVGWVGCGGRLGGLRREMVCGICRMGTIRCAGGA